MTNLILADSLTFGAYVGYFFFVVAGLLLIGAVIGAVANERVGSEYGSPAGGRWIAFWAAVTGLVVLVITLFAMWPLEYPYHHWVEVRGQVTNINRRIVSTGDHSISQRYVVLVRGQQYGVDDTRAALLKRGDPVSLRCKKEHQFMQPHDADGWACRWGSQS